MPTVTGTLISADGTALNKVAVLIQSVSAPTTSDTYVVSVTRRTVDTDVDGDFSITLEAGDYSAEWKNGSVLTVVNFAVPTGGGPYTLHDIISDELVYTRTVEPKYMLKSDADQSFRVHNGHLEIYNYTTERWNPITNTGAAGSERIGLGGAS
jgi:hypothetical protein